MTWDSVYGAVLCGTEGASGGLETGSMSLGRQKTTLLETVVALIDVPQRSAPVLTA